MRIFNAANFSESVSSPVSPSGSKARSLFSVALCSSVIAASVLMSAAPAQATPLATKRAQAAALNVEVGKLEAQYSDLSERYRGELVKLRELNKDVKSTQKKLDRSRADLQVSKDRLETRAMAVYRDGSGSRQVLEIARAGSFSNFFEKLETIERVSDQDAAILERVRALTARIERAEKRLKTQRKAKAEVVKKAKRAEAKMKQVLDSKQSALNSVTADIRRMMEAQRAAEAARITAASQARVAQIRNGRSGATIADDAPVSNTGGANNSNPNSASSGSAVQATAPAEATAPAPVVALPPASGAASAAAGIAMGKIGKPYVYGASGPNSFDCSGLVMWAFAQAGRSGLPHSTYSLIGMGVEVPLSQAQVGDLVFTDNAGHVGIYVGGGSIVHAPRTGRPVSVDSLTYYNVISVRRI